MTEPTRRDGLDELRDANPIDPDRLPSASLTRMSVRMQEMTMEATTDRSRWRRRLLPSLAGVALAAIVVVAIMGNKGPAPSIVPGGSSNVGAASCVETYGPNTLVKRSFAFDGTVTGIAGDEVTFKVNARYKGTGGETVTLTATGMTGTAITSAAGPNLAVGERYLVAGEEHFAWACGFTQPYDAAVAAQWAAAFGG